MTARTSGSRLRDLAGRVTAFLGHGEPRPPLSRWSLAADAGIALAATAGVLAETFLARPQPGFPAGTTFAPIAISPGGPAQRTWYAATLHHRIIGIEIGLPVPAPPHPSLLILAGIVAATLPLAARRRYPAAAITVTIAAIILTRGWSQPVTFAAAILGAYSAVVYSRFRQLALLAVLAGAVIVTTTFPNTLPHVAERYTAALVLAPTVAVAIGIREWRRRAGDSAERLRRAQAGHEAATRRAVELERARIASELHDVVTHNVSVMVVQAGACRRVLATSPGDARAALLAVEASGRTAMAELRHLLGLLSPPGDGAPGADGALHPQPGLGQLSTLLGRVAAAGLAAELHTAGTPRGLPPGLDLAAYRVVQEALTNVIKHAGRAPASVRLDFRPDELVIDVTDAGRPAAHGGPRAVPGPDAGRGLVGLRERIALYGGELDAGPQPGGGWRVRARIPLYGPSADGPDDALALAGLHPAAP